MTTQPRTPAEMQIEALRRLKQAGAPKKSAPERQPAPDAVVARQAARRAGLQVSASTWRRLLARQREHHEFRSRREMGDWAAELLLALPPMTHQLSAAARAELLARMREWAEGRGLR